MLKHVKSPDVFTLSSLAVAVISIYFSLEGKYKLAMGLLPLSVLLDTLDGFVARITQRQGVFGKELDSLVDLVAYGATLTVFWLSASNRTVVDILVVVIFLAASALRLAALNIKPANEPNQGVPDAVNALIFSFAYFLGLKRFFPILFIVGAVLMLAPVRVPKLRISLKDGKIPFIYFE